MLKKRSRARQGALANLGFTIALPVLAQLEAILDAESNNGRNVIMTDLLREGVSLVIDHYDKKHKGVKPPPETIAKPEEQNEMKPLVSKPEQKIKCDGKYRGVDNVERQCRLSENGYCIKSTKPLSCPKMTKEEVEEMRQRGKGGVKEEAQKE